MKQNEIISELKNRKNEILMTVEIGKKDVPELQKIRSEYDYLVLLEYKPGKFTWFNTRTGNFDLWGKTAFIAIADLMNTGYSISYAVEGNIFFQDDEEA